ncbi:MAG: hypothetical protein COA74_06640 [Gammaproteobacteria bacterium]|nr:MAG: hypothetical protein COA74_06640 [Gammaproteobacteria bacterium]
MKTVGVVLAGGLSSRMLEDKSQLIWQQNTLLEHTKKLLEKAGCSEVIVSHNQLQACVKDRYLQSGPLAGIEASLAYIAENISDVDFMLIMPVDMPLVPKQLLTELMQKAVKDKAIYYPLGRFPLLLPVGDKLSKLLMEILEKSDGGKAASIKKLLSHFDNLILPLDKDQQNVFFNCNTPEQWRSLSSN